MAEFNPLQASQGSIELQHGKQPTNDKGALSKFLRLRNPGFKRVERSQDAVPTVNKDETISKLKEFLNLPNLEEMLSKSQSLDVLIVGDLGESNIVEGLIGMQLSAMIRTSESGEIVVYRARREGVDVTLWNAPSLDFDQVNYIQEIKKILEHVDLKLLYLGHCRSKKIAFTKLKPITDAFGTQFLNGSMIVVSSADISADQLLSTMEKCLNDSETVSVQSVRKEKEISTIFFKDEGKYKKVIVVHPTVTSLTCTLNSPVHMFNPDWRSRLFFDCIQTKSSSLDTKGALLKLNVKRLKAVFVPYFDETENTPIVHCPVEEHPLTFRVRQVWGPCCICGLLGQQFLKDFSEQPSELSHGGATPTSTPTPATPDKQ